MGKDATYALEAGIYSWIDDNKELVKIAQKLASLTVNLGLCDTNSHNPFQIVPIEEFSSDGNLKHEIFLNIDHAAWGYFKIVIKSEFNFEMIPPRLTLLDKTIFLNQHEVEEFINFLSNSLDDLYKLQEYIETNNIIESQNLLDIMLVKYHQDVDDHLKYIKNYVESMPAEIYLKATNSEDKQLLDLNSRYDLALMHPENWYLKNYRGILTNNAALEELRLKITDFFITESQSAALLYVAQKLIKESGFDLIVHTDSTDPEPDISGKVMIDDKMNITLVRPVIHSYKLEILNNG